jgi:hypothetical protein
LVLVFHFVISTITSQQAQLYPKDKIMTTNEIFAALDDVIIGLELMALAVLLFFIYQKVSQFFWVEKSIRVLIPLMQMSCCILILL